MENKYKNGKQPPKKFKNSTSYDPQWVHLIIEAKNIGLPIEEVRKFLRLEKN